MGNALSYPPSPSRTVSFKNIPHLERKPNARQGQGRGGIKRLDYPDATLFKIPNDRVFIRIHDEVSM